MDNSKCIINDFFVASILEEARVFYCYYKIPSRGRRLCEKCFRFLSLLMLQNFAMHLTYWIHQCRRSMKLNCSVLSKKPCPIRPMILVLFSKTTKARWSKRRKTCLDRLYNIVYKWIRETLWSQNKQSCLHRLGLRHVVLIRMYVRESFTTLAKNDNAILENSCFRSMS